MLIAKKYCVFVYVLWSLEPQVTATLTLFTPPEPTALGVKPLLWVCGLQKNTGPRNSLAVCSHTVGRTREGVMTRLVFVGLGSAGPKYPNSGLLSVRGGDCDGRAQRGASHLSSLPRAAALRSSYPDSSVRGVLSHGQQCVPPQSRLTLGPHGL